MFAIVTIAGQQFKVEKDQEIFVHKMDAEEGDSVSFDQVNLVDNGGTVNVGTPQLAGASVSATVLGHQKGDKVIVFKKKRRKGYRVKNGHRQSFTNQAAIAGNIIVRQRGTKFHPGENVNMGKDHTIHALVEGTVVFHKKRNNKTYVSILPAEGVTTIKPRKAKKAKSAAPKADASANAPQAKKAAPKKAAAPMKEAAPKAQAPAAPKQEAPKAEAPKPAAPKQEAPKTDAPKADLKTTTTTSTPNVSPEIGGSTSEMPKGIKMNDLTTIEGIGPKSAEALVAAGIDTWEKLGNTMASKIKEVLDAADGNFGMMDPGTWPTQAKMAHEGKWALLKAWQDKLDGGKEVK